MKPDADTLLTVPTVPPAAGPDRALDPLAPDPEPPAKGLPLLLVPLLAVVRGAAGGGCDDPVGTAPDYDGRDLRPR